jgi:hypothetical protein
MAPPPSPPGASTPGRHDEARDGDFYLATSGDLDPATHGDFLMAMDTLLGWVMFGLSVLLFVFSLWLERKGRRV